MKPSPPPVADSKTKGNKKTAKKKKKKKKKIDLSPSITIAKKIAFSKNVEIVDSSYFVKDRYIHKRESLTVTANGVLSARPWNPNDPKLKKGGIIRIKAKKIRIEKGGIILCSGRGWFGKYGHGMAEKLKHYDLFGGASYGSLGNDYYDSNTKTLLKKGNVYGEKELISLYPGTGNKYLSAGGIIELVADEIVNEGYILCNGSGGTTGGSVFLCSRTFINEGTVECLGGEATSFSGKGGDGRIAIYCDNFENNGKIKPKPFIFEPKNDEKEQSIFEYGLKIIAEREPIKMNVIYRESKKQTVLLRHAPKINPKVLETKKAIDAIINFLMKHEEKITNPEKEVYDKLNIKKDIRALLTSKIGFDQCAKHRKLYYKTKFREKMIIGRLVLELKWVLLLSSADFIEFSMINRATDDLFDHNTMAILRYTNGRIEPFNDLLPRICWRLSFEYHIRNTNTVKKQKSDFKFRQKSLESKICLWEFEGRDIQSYELLAKVDRTNDKFTSLLKNNCFADQKSVNISSSYQLESDKLNKCGLLRVEKSAKLYPKEWYSDSKSGGRISIQCIDLVSYGNIDASSKGQYGKYGKGHGKLRKDKKKKTNAKRKVNKANENEDYYFGASFSGDETLAKLVFGTGIAGKKCFKGGGIIDLYIRDHVSYFYSVFNVLIRCNLSLRQFINYGTISSDGSLSSSGGSIVIICKKFVNWGTIQSIGGKDILGLSTPIECI